MLMLLLLQSTFVKKGTGAKMHIAPVPIKSHFVGSYFFGVASGAAVGASFDVSLEAAFAVSDTSTSTSSK